jgi:hypothetical protein
MLEDRASQDQLVGRGSFDDRIELLPHRRWQLTVARPKQVSSAAWVRPKKLKK